MNARLSLISGLISGLIAISLIAYLSLAGRRQGSRAAVAAPPSRITFGPEDLFVSASTASDLLEAWRWKVGQDATVVRITVFGDLFIRTGDGCISWLDTGSNRYVDVAGSTEQWAKAAEAHGMEWFHGSTLLELRDRGVKLAPGQVYSWRHPPFLGGAEAADNVDVIDLEVHVSNAGRLAAAVKDVPPGARIEKADFQPVSPAGNPEPKVWGPA